MHTCLNWPRRNWHEHSSWLAHLLKRVTFAVVLLVGAAARAAVPDFSGVWELYPPPNYDSLDESAPAAPSNQSGPGGQPQLREPFAKAYEDLLKLRSEAYERGEPLVDSGTQCLPEGMPTIMGAVQPLEILQTPRQLVVLAEFVTQTRRIYLNEKMPPVDDISPSYNGYSVGHWERDTLVVQTIGVREDVKLWDVLPRSANMRVTERLRLTAPDMLENQVTIDDPAVLLKPYQLVFQYKKQPGYRITEYICSNNRNMVEPDGSVKLDLTRKAK